MKKTGCILVSSLVLIFVFALPALGAASARTLVRDQQVVIVDLTGGNGDAAAIRHLSEYLESCLGRKPQVTGAIVRTGTEALIFLGGADLAARYSLDPVTGGSDESYSLATALQGGPLAVISGKTARGVKRGIQRFIFLTRQEPDGSLRIPAVAAAEKPWQPTREYMLVNWSPNDVRTRFSNRMVNKQVDVVYRYGDEQIRRYVEMFDELGFTGVQLGESSVSWSMAGSKEAYQDRIRRIAQAAHAVGQKVSYLFWAAEFNVGWIDPGMVYQPQPGDSAFEDPAVRAYFTKYYDHYVKMAPYVDLVIGHWFDAGRLKSIDDVISYQKLLRDKMRASNPQLRFAVNTWGHPEFFDALIDAGMNDFLLLEMSMPFAVSAEKRSEFRRRAKQNGFDVGIWGWYMTEYETDQVPNMHVNGHIMKEYINSVRTGPEKILPSSYWSEMEAYHLANIYTMYQTAQLLWNPDRDPDELLHEITDAIWGPKDAPYIFDALKLIEDTRSGNSWSTFSYRSAGRQDGTEDPHRDADRARESLSRLATRVPDPEYVPKLTLPVSRTTLLEIMLPHLEQIRRFAEFRLAFKQVEASAAAGASKETLRKRIAAIWHPIPEFDTWIGTYGQAEAWRQDRMIAKFCEQLGILPPVPAWKRSRDRHRVLQEIQGDQRVLPDAKIVDPAQISDEFHLHMDLGEDREYSRSLLDELVEAGQLEKVDDDQYRLTRWEDTAFLVRLRLGRADYSRGPAP